MQIAKESCPIGIRNVGRHGEVGSMKRTAGGYVMTITCDCQFIHTYITLTHAAHLPHTIKSLMQTHRFLSQSVLHTYQR